MTAKQDEESAAAPRSGFSTEHGPSFFGRIWHHSPDNMFIVRRMAPRQYLAEAINPALAEVLRLTPDGGINRPLDELVAPDYLEQVIERYEDCIQRASPINYEEAGAAPGQPVMYWNTLLVPVIEQDGPHARIYGISRNITHIRDMERALLRAHQAMDQRVAGRTRELEQINRTLHRLATRDELTQTYNRRHFFELATRVLDGAPDLDSPLSLLMLDVDHFKAVNDRYGHVAGDRMLRLIADACRRNLREQDIFGRYGGEEFAILLPGTAADNATKIAERIRKTVAYTYLGFAGQRLNCTVSVGLAAWGEGVDNFQRLLHYADTALLTAKRQGRNCVVHYRPGDEEAVPGQP